MAHLALKLDTRQKQAMTPRLQYAVRLLQLSSLDYEQELHEVMGRNPFLELDEPPSGRLADSDGQVDPAPSTQTPDGQPSGEHLGEVDSDASWEDRQDSWVYAEGGIRDGANSDSGAPTSAIDLRVADVGLRQQLRSQANMLPLSDRDRALVCAVIESLDDDGYLRVALGEIAELVALDPAADECEMGMALKLVQSFEPAGSGARTVSECLLLQLQQTAPANINLCVKIVSAHLERLAQRDTPGLSRLLGRPAAEVEAACEVVRRLDPRPGWRFGSSDVHFVKPDVMVRKVRGKWVAQLNRAVVPNLKINQTYAELFQRHREAKHGELGAHLQEARWAVRNVEQRFSTILAVAQAIVRRQYGYFEYGALAMKPLALRDIAHEVGVHQSTVCRVTNNKYMATPSGLVELKQFFSRPMPMTSGGACSPTAIRGLLQELLAAENPAFPLSDVEIARRLGRQGLTVARRTVTKYRQMLRVPSVENRRRIHSLPAFPAEHPAAQALGM